MVMVRCPLQLFVALWRPELDSLYIITYCLFIQLLMQVQGLWTS